jgi:transcriptional regulator with XRE-family HTH domain
MFVFVDNSVLNWYRAPGDTRRTKRKVGYMMEGSLAAKLRVLRAQRGLTLTEAAERAGVQRQTLAFLERGERIPHTPTLTKIAKGYGVPVEGLLEEPVLSSGKADAPEAGRQHPGVPGDDQPVLAEVQFRKIKAVGDAAQRADHRWRREAAKSLKEGRPLAEDRTLEMLGLHNELSRVFAASVESVLAGARRGLIKIADDEGTVRLLGPEPARWPRELKQPLYEAGARISALHGLVEKMERAASGQRQETAAQALYGEFNVEDRLPAAVLRDPEWREELDKALAGLA